MQEATFSGACQDQHAGRPAPSLGWPGERKSISATSRGKRRFWQQQISRCNKSRLGLPGAWGPGLGAGAFMTLGPGPGLHFRRSEKSPGGRQAKGWETAETAAAEVGAWREAGTGYPPYPPQKRVFTLSVMETTPQGRWTPKT